MKLLISFFLIVFTTQGQGQKSFPDGIQMNDSLFMKIMSGYEDPGWAFDNFSAETTNGRIYTIDSLKNKISFINFWFEGCHPCIAEFPALNDLYAKFKSRMNFQFLSFTYETKENAARVAEKYHLEYPVICFDQGIIRKLNHGLGYPTTILVDGRGTIRFIKIGGSLKETQIRQTVDIVYADEIERLLRE